MKQLVGTTKEAQDELDTLETKDKNTTVDDYYCGVLLKLISEPLLSTYHTRFSFFTYKSK